MNIKRNVSIYLVTRRMNHIAAVLTVIKLELIAIAKTTIIII